MCDAPYKLLHRAILPKMTRLRGTFLPSFLTLGSCLLVFSYMDYCVPI